MRDFARAVDFSDSRRRGQTRGERCAKPQVPRTRVCPPYDALKTGSNSMCRWMSTAVIGTALLLAAMPAQAAWKNYINKEFGFSFTAPGEIKTEVGNFRGRLAGPHQTIVYRS